MVKVCGGAAGCPLSVIEDQQVAQVLADELKRLQLAEHHKFKTAVAGCPNGCSEPQIKDLAVIGQLKPVLEGLGCTGCGLCRQSCMEGALELKSRTIAIDENKCLGCGSCIEACSKGVFTPRLTYKVLVGGRLGRHPRLAEELIEVDSLDKLRVALAGCLKLYKDQGQPGERLSHLVERLSLEAIRDKIGKL